MNSDADLLLMDKDRISRSLHRMAHEIVEQNPRNKPVILFGVNDRGYTIAKILDDILRPMTDYDIQSVQLLLNKSNKERHFPKTEIDETADSFVITVDDVIFSGKTMFTALKEISDHIQISEIHTAVLIDRGHRKFPVQAEFCGMELPTKLNEHVSVKMKEGKIQQVSLINREN